MVEVEKKLMEILDLRKDTFTGEDIKNVVDSIILCKINTPAEIDPNIKTAEELRKEWMGE